MPFFAERTILVIKCHLNFGSPSGTAKVIGFEQRTELFFGLFSFGILSGVRDGTKKDVYMFSRFGNLLQLCPVVGEITSICLLMYTHAANKELQPVEGRYASYISACVGLRQLTPGFW